MNPNSKVELSQIDRYLKQRIKKTVCAILFGIDCMWFERCANFGIQYLKKKIQLKDVGVMIFKINMG